MRTYPTTIDYLFNLLPMYQRDGKKALKKDLTNIRALCDRLSNPQESYPTMHIAGTNGKGTVTHLIASILISEGKKVGLYTSPHYQDFRERIKIGNTWISEQEVVEWVAIQQSMIEEIRPSFFEVTVAMAFDHFARHNVDIAIIETGLGGRLDSTNMLNPLLSVITHISLDHQHILGDTIYDIAKEKAGIIKSQTPVVIGKYQTSCDQVFLAKARAMQASITWASLNWTATAVNEYTWRFSKGDKQIDIHIDPQESPFLIENIVTALEAIDRYTHNKVSWNPEKIINGIENYRTLTGYIGRWQILSTQPFIIADSAHNEDAIRTVLSEIAKLDHHKKHFVIGFVKDKDLSSILSLFPTDATYYFVQAQINRSLPAQELQLMGNTLGRGGNCYNDVQLGIAAAKSAAQIDDLIYIGGSSFVVGDALKNTKPQSYL